MDDTTKLALEAAAKAKSSMLTASSHLTECLALLDGSDDESAKRLVRTAIAMTAPVLTIIDGLDDVLRTE